MRTRPGPITYNPPGAPGSGPSAAIDPNIQSLADLAAVRTTTLVPIVIRLWVMAADGTSQLWRLYFSTADSDGESIQRPNDYNPVSNAKVWFKAST